MTKEPGADRPVRVTDRRRGGEEAPAGRHPGAPEAPSAPRGPEDPGAPEAPGTRQEAEKLQEAAPPVEADAQPLDYLNDLRRLQAEFDNYRKRMVKEQTAMARRASARLIERLLPVLDNFEAAIAHGQAGTGVELIYKELKSVLEKEGLKEIDAEGALFNPRVHHAVDSRESPDVTAPVVLEVYQRGYTLDGRVLRAAMVVTAHPAEVAAETSVDHSQDRDIGLEEAE